MGERAVSLQTDNASFISTEQLFNSWAVSAATGSLIMYHEGDEGQLIKSVAFRHAVLGRVFLFQKRHPRYPSRWQYYALKLSEEAGRVLRAKAKQC